MFEGDSVAFYRGGVVGEGDDAVCESFFFGEGVEACELVAVVVRACCYLECSFFAEVVVVAQFLLSYVLVGPVRLEESLNGLVAFAYLVCVRFGKLFESLFDAFGVVTEVGDVFCVLFAVFAQGCAQIVVGGVACAFAVKVDHTKR